METTPLDTVLGYLAPGSPLRSVAMAVATLGS